MSIREERKRESHDRIVEAASRLLREHGIEGAGVAEIMREAGLTHGGFYSHFDSREELVAEAVTHAANRSRSGLFARLDGRTGVEWLRAAFRRYLSRAHRDDPALGCPLTSFAGEVARRDEEVREAFEAELRRTAEHFRDQLHSADVRDPAGRALALIALCTGGLSLSRAVSDPALSDRILRACRDLAARGYDDPAADG